MGKANKFLKYTLRFDMTMEDFNANKDLHSKLNTQNDNDTGVWTYMYGLSHFGGQDGDDGVKMLACTGQINSGTAKDCKAAFQLLKSELKDTLGVKKIEEIFVGSGTLMF